MRGKIDTNYEALRVVENQPVSFDGVTIVKPIRLQGLDQPETTLAMMVKVDLFVDQSIEAHG